jgi:hypothetical protein
MKWTASRLSRLIPVDRAAVMTKLWTGCSWYEYLQVQGIFLYLGISRQFQYLLKPTHAQLKTHVKTQCFNKLKCPCPYRPTCFDHDTDHPQGLNVLRTATCSPYVVFFAQPYSGLWPALCLRCRLYPSAARLDVYSIVFLPQLSTHPGEQWRGRNGSVNREQATGQSMVVQKIQHMASR